MELFPSVSKEELRNKILENVKTFARKPINRASDKEVYDALAFAIRDIVSDKWIKTHDTYDKEDIKTVYYLSMEFLMGRFLGNTAINLSMDKEIKEILEEFNIDYTHVEEAERDPGLGNGGLGRLAACFLDSLSTLEYPAYGCGIRYRYGIFEQDIIDGYQVEKPDNWLEYGDAWGVKRPEHACEVHFYGNVKTEPKEEGGYRYYLDNTQSVMAVPYDYPVLGYDNNTVNTLRLWESQAKNKFDLESFNKGNYAKAVEEDVLARQLSEVLYPADEFLSGKELRLKQQYFFISATLQTAIKKFLENNDDFRLIPEKIAFQLNDTHPSLTVPELMRILVDEYDVDWDTAWEITTNTCAYTNHTIMPEALEKWPSEMFSRLLPRIYMFIEEINRRFCAELVYKYGNSPEKIRDMAIIADGQVRMAYLALVGSHSVNGVARIHSEILKDNLFKDFYSIYPERFNNKTNGITQRRWLLHSNPKLSGLIRETIGEGFETDLDKLKELNKYKDDSSFQEKFMNVKRENKVFLSNYILDETGILINPDSIYDIQIKRLHEYKRQLINALHILDLYHEIRLNPNIDMEPRTFIFGAKSAAGYKMAKLIIKFINSIADLVNNDPLVNKKMNVLFLKNYRVSLAEKLIPAADVSEQTSTAGKEASGTGNMKFMLNGALTIGTMDGANVEIYEEVGNDNIFIFGMSAEEVADLYKSNTYNPWDIYNMNYDLQRVLNTMIDGTLDPDLNLFRDLYDSLLNGFGGQRADEYFVLKDYESYKNAHKNINDKYKDRSGWAKSAIINTANSGKFSSDRTIEQYANEIWNLKKLPIIM